MVNYKAYKIIDKHVESGFGFISFELKDYIDLGWHYGMEVKGKGWIDCANHSPYSSYKVGDWLEIDLDRIGDKKNPHVFDDTSVVRKLGSSSEVVSSSSTGMVIGSTTITREHGLAVARELDSYVEQSGGRNEYTASIEAYDNNGRPIKFSLSSRRANN